MTDERWGVFDSSFLGNTDDAFASTVNYAINIITKNRAMSPAEQEAIYQAVQNALNLLSVQAQFIVSRDPNLVKVGCTRASSSGGVTVMLPQMEVSHEGT